MVYYEAANRGSYSTGELWHDSAVNAARMVEKYIHQEEQNLQLSEMLSEGYRIMRNMELIGNILSRIQPQIRSQRLLREGVVSRRSEH